jgi:catechol 2,3-dioxygenase-like lactoylglutathione lyase family enzyme
MAESIKVAGLHHLALRVTDLARSRAFYTEALGFSILKEDDGFCIVDTSGTPLGLLGPAGQSNDRFDPFRVGVDHLALVVESVSDLERIKQRLDEWNVSNNGIEVDPVLGGTYVSFYDPDGIAWEAYVLP